MSSFSRPLLPLLALFRLLLAVLFMVVLKAFVATTAVYVSCIVIQCFFVFPIGEISIKINNTGKSKDLVLAFLVSS